MRFLTATIDAPDVRPEPKRRIKWDAVVECVVSEAFGAILSALAETGSRL
jgi:hypothetical protein